MGRQVAWVLLALGLAAPAAANDSAEQEAARLAEAAGRYRQLAGSGGWQPIPAGPSLHPACQHVVWFPLAGNGQGQDR